MGLVAYNSDSDSEPETFSPPPKSGTKRISPSVDGTSPSTRSATQPGQKVVDRANPRRITVHLGDAKAGSGSNDLSDAVTPSNDQSQCPPTKRPRTGKGAFSDFNSLLPPPKKIGSGGTVPVAAERGKGSLKLGGNLKTGFAPSFSRNELVSTSSFAAATEDHPERRPQSGRTDLPFNGSSEASLEKTHTRPPEEVQIVGSNTMFVPLTVGAKKKQKKTRTVAEILAAQAAAARTAATGSAHGSTTSAATSIAAASSNRSSAEKDLPQSKNSASGGPEAPPQPAISLFSLPTKRESHFPSLGNSNADGEGEEEEEEEDAAVYSASGNHQSHGLGYQNQSFSDPHSHFPNPPSGPSQPHTLDTIAQDLNLSEAAKRQLFGRNAKHKQKHQPQSTSVEVAHFNTEEQYAQNEELRMGGEIAQHNPLKSIRAGKHSLKQLVNAATSQKEALEEHFAAGKKNRHEATARYGW